MSGCGYHRTSTYTQWDKTGQMSHQWQIHLLQGYSLHQNVLHSFERGGFLHKLKDIVIKRCGLLVFGWSRIRLISQLWLTFCIEELAKENSLATGGLGTHHLPFQNFIGNLFGSNNSKELNDFYYKPCIVFSSSWSPKKCAEVLPKLW